MFDFKWAVAVVAGVLIAHFADVHKDTSSSGEGRRHLWRQYNGYKYPGTFGENLPEGVTWQNDFFFNDKGSLIHYQEWTAAEQGNAVVLMIPGYGDHGQSQIAWGASDFAAAGISAIVIDHQGQGLSDGLHAFHTDTSALVDDCERLLGIVRERYPNKIIFVYGESMGGALSIMLSLRESARKHLAGLLLLAPMVKVSDETLPPPFVVSLLKKVAYLAPRLPLAPAADILSQCFKDPAHFQRIRDHPLSYGKLPRLGTADCMLGLTQEIGERMEEVVSPFLLLHGSADTVTCPEISKELHTRASSTDKQIKILDGMWHGLTVEPERHLVFDALFDFIKERS